MKKFFIGSFIGVIIFACMGTFFYTKREVSKREEPTLEVQIEQSSPQVQVEVHEEVEQDVLIKTEPEIEVEEVLTQEEILVQVEPEIAVEEVLVEEALPIDEQEILVQVEPEVEIEIASSKDRKKNRRKKKKKEKVIISEQLQDEVDEQPAEPEDNLIELDAIHAVLFTTDGTELITQSDVIRSGLTGQQRPVEEIMFERLVYLDAKKHKVDIDDAAVERYLARVVTENNLRPEDLKTIFSQEGFTFEEGKVHLQKMQTVSTMLDYKIRSNLVIPKKEITKYYTDHPEKEQAEYKLEIASVVYDPGLKRDVQKKKLRDRACGLTQGPDLDWMEPFWVKAEDLAADKQFVTSMKAGDVEIVRTDSSFELYRIKELKPERIKTLDERYHEIADILRMPKYEELITEYRNSLFDSASIVMMA